VGRRGRDRNVPDHRRLGPVIAVRRPRTVGQPCPCSIVGPRRTRGRRGDQCGVTGPRGAGRAGALERRKPGRAGPTPPRSPTGRASAAGRRPGPPRQLDEPIVACRRRGGAGEAPALCPSGRPTANAAEILAGARVDLSRRRPSLRERAAPGPNGGRFSRRGPAWCRPCAGCRQREGPGVRASRWASSTKLGTSTVVGHARRCTRRPTSVFSFR